MKEAYAVRRTVQPSAEIQASIDRLLSKGMVDDPQKMLSELARLGARLSIQRAVEEEFDSCWGRARYERRPERQRGVRNYESGLRNGFRPRHLQTAEGELRIEIPQVREAAMPFISKLFPKWHCKRLLRSFEGAISRLPEIAWSEAARSAKKRQHPAFAGELKTLAASAGTVGMEHDLAARVDQSAANGCGSERQASCRRPRRRSSIARARGRCAGSMRAWCHIARYWMELINAAQVFSRDSLREAAAGL